MVEQIRPEQWEIDDDNLSEMASGGMDEETFFQVVYEAPRFRRNKNDHAGTHQMVGPDRGGCFWVVPILEIDHDEGAWRPITAWKADPEDRNWYDKGGEPYARASEEKDVTKRGA